MAKQDPRAVLAELRSQSGRAAVTGLTDDELAPFLSGDSLLPAAIDDAATARAALSADEKSLLEGSESELCNTVQSGILNFYAAGQRAPYVPLAARGPWIVTTHGAVVYDAGGYGMLSFGHNDPAVRAALARPQVMANVMTPSLAQHRLLKTLFARVGETRGGSPFAKFLFLNSGSEAMTVALRISDAAAKVHTEAGAIHEGKHIAFLAVEQGFHGRTDRPAQASPSSQKPYAALASFRGEKRLWTVKPNDVGDLEAVFERAARENLWFESLLLEPVMGEGKPGVGVTPEFYRRAREITRQQQTLLIVDSIQAGLRAHGVLSILDYPGFQKLDPPDCETYSKAINAGQIPFSVLALNDAAAHYLVPGLYGNTMTANPRALDVADTVLSLMTPAIKANIRERGLCLKDRLGSLRTRWPDRVIEVTGTGLLLGVELDESIPVVGRDGVENALRVRGLNVIHGGKNALRYTPHFRITDEECDLIVRLTAEAVSGARISERR